MVKLLAKLFIKNHNNYEDLKVRESYGVLCGVLGVVFNIISSGIKIFAGIISGSIAILSDGLNNLADMASSLIAIISAKLSNRKPDKEHPFGHGRYEYIASLVVSFLILFMAFELMKSSINKIIDFEPITYNPIIVYILIASIILKLWMFVFNRIYGKKTSSMVLQATSVDSLSDAITTIVILLATIFGHNVNFPIDAIGGALVSILIAIGGIKVAKNAVEILLGTPPSADTIKKINDMVLSGEGIIGTHDLMVHDYGPGRSFASIHAEVNDDVDIVAVHEVIDAIEEKIFNELGIQMVIHMDPISTSSKVLFHKQITIDTIYNIDSKLKLHDFRMVYGVNQINLIFDLVVPHDYTHNQKSEIVERINEELSLKDERYKAVIKVETEYI